MFLQQTMTSEQKKTFLLLTNIIFSYHGLDDEEKKILEETVVQLDARTEYEWVQSFMEEDFYTAFDRAREYFSKTIANYDKETKLNYLDMVWKSTNRKGYISEMEATAILKLAKDWGVQRELIALVRSK